MGDKFNELTAREKLMVIIMGVLIVLFILWQFILSPLLNFHGDAQRQQVKAQKDRAYIEQNIARLGQGAATSEVQEFSRETLVRLSRDAGIERLNRIQPQPNGDLKIWIDDVSGPVLFEFLGRIERGYATRITGAQVTRKDTDFVSAQISFSMPVKTSTIQSNGG
ncbi:MAG: type II secretion system protein GspM [Maricaulaceae bacterium]